MTGKIGEKTGETAASEHVWGVYARQLKSNSTDF
jgi:hypothetical protein